MINQYPGNSMGWIKKIDLLEMQEKYDQAMKWHYKKNSLCIFIVFVDESNSESNSDHIHFFARKKKVIHIWNKKNIN